MSPRSTEEWESLLVGNPKVLWGLVADVVKAVKANEGEKRTGRRPAVSLSSLDELYEVLFPPAYANRPLAEALGELLKTAGYSQRTFATAAGFNQSTMSRLMAGKTAPTVELIERIAYHLDIRPAYFAEYRAMKLGQVVTDVLLNHPDLSIETVRNLARAA